MTQVSAREQLAQSLNARVATYQVADMILRLDLTLPAKLQRALKKLSAEGSRMIQGRHDDFDVVDSADSQFATFRELFPDILVSSVEQFAVLDPEYVPAHEAVVRAGMEFLGHGDMAPSEALKQHHQLTWQAGDASSKKAFLKRLRFLNSYQEKLDRVADMVQFRHAQQQAKSRLAYLVDTSSLDDASLAYVAYLASRANRRSMFMLGGQSKAFDDVSDGLFELLGDDTDWFQIALVRPTGSVFRRLSPEQLGNLTAVFYKQMVVASDTLSTLWDALPARMRAEMVMVKGVDSSRWNAYAGAYNTMRSAWIAAVSAAGLDEVFDSFMPGKVGRLMASDLVHWSRGTGSGLHSDTILFAELPKPWEVISNSKTLTRPEVLKFAEEEKIEDVEKNGWVAPRRDLKLEVASAEPALVHGVAVLNPELYEVLRRSGAYSGNPVKADEMPETLSVHRLIVHTRDNKTIPFIL